MISTSNLGKSFGARTLFEGATLELVPGARYGLVGANGSGKTTLLKILAGDEPASEGQVVLPKQARVGVLRQDQFQNDAEPILEATMAGDSIVTEALLEQARWIASGENPERVAELEDRIAAHDGYTLRARSSHVLEGLGIPVAQHEKPIATLSGGFKLRVLLARVLIGGPDILLLDEPTNHLDILSIRWLEKFLGGYRGCAVVISHDQRFLDNVATHILDVDYQTVTAYPGNYAAFEVAKRETHARKAAEIARAEATIAEKKAWIERFGAKATKARQAQSRLKQLERIEVEELEQTSRRAPKFHFEPERPSGKDVLELRGVSKAYGEKVVLKDVSLTLRRGERLAVIGPNGLGKSTLLKIVTGRLQQDAGSSTLGHEVRLGYFAQDHHELLSDPNAQVLDVIWDTIPQETTSYVRGKLGNLLFSGQDVHKTVGALSGGEAARLVFCRIMVQKPNLLVLDEPTNHLDIESIHALVQALQAFDGTVLFVSHDRAFVAALATRILEVTPQGFRAFAGTYAEYLAQAGDDHLDSNAVVLRDKQEKAKAAGEKPATGALSWEEQKKRKNRIKQLPNERDRVLAAIEAAERRKSEIQTQWGDPGFYEKTAPDQIAALQAEEKQLEARILEWMGEWEAIELELAALSAT